MNTRICKKCREEKNMSDFRSIVRKEKLYYRWVCKKCETKENKDRHLKYRQNNIEKLREISKTYYTEHKEDIKERYQEKKKEWNRVYYENNKSKILISRQKYVTNRYNIDSCFRIRKVISKAIYRGLKRNYSTKQNNSCLRFLPYSIQELNVHLESQFEPWMSWDNYGKYNVNTWDDNDQSTWTWQIDHVIPQSTFKYTSMEDEEFKQCWSLDNLRPLSSKKNWSDGIYRIRHQGAV